MRGGRSEKNFFSVLRASVWCKSKDPLDPALSMLKHFPTTRDLVTINLFSLKMFVAGWETRAFSDLAVHL